MVNVSIPRFRKGRQAAAETGKEKTNMRDLERKFGRYAISNLSLILVILYAVGYVLQYTASWLIPYLSLNPYAIVHGQVWRLVTWLLIPPEIGNLFFVAIMLFFYYSIGTSLERTWGDFRYNVFILTGILLTVLMSFVWMGAAFLTEGGTLAAYGAEAYFGAYSILFNTYYINMSIFMAYALTFPDAVVLLMFFIPIKVKWLGIIDAVYLAFQFVVYSDASRYAILAAFINIGILWLTRGGWSRVSPGEVHRRASFRRNMREGAAASRTIHRCAICGRTEEDNPSLEFRYCSKCEDNYEYCSDHLFTHVHVRHGEHPRMIP